MKFNLKNYDNSLEDKEINIPDKELEKLMKSLDISESEAIEIYLTDEGYVNNDEQDELTQKAKESRITATIHEARADGKKKRVVERKEDPTKEGLIKYLAGAITMYEGAAAVNIVNVGKIIEFELDGDSYKLDLIRRRKPKK